MLRVWRISGDELASFPAEELSNVRALKRSLQPLCGLPRFRQRLHHNGLNLEDDVELHTAPNSLQLVLLPFASASQEEVAELMLAADTGSAGEVEGILQRPQDPNLEPESSPLFAASRGGHAEVVRLLLEAGARTSQGNCEGDTPLHAASAHGLVEVVRLLLEAKADSSSNSLGLTPLHMASQRGHLETVRLLLPPKAANGQSATLGLMPILPIASAYGQVAVVRLLLEAAADKDQSDRLGLTPLCAAAQYGEVETVRTLLEARADRDHRAHAGLTPLQVASAQGHVAIVKLLLEAGARKEERDSRGLTALWMASQKGHDSVVRLLQAGSEGSEASNPGQPPSVLTDGLGTASDKAAAAPNAQPP